MLRQARNIFQCKYSSNMLAIWWKHCLGFSGPLDSHIFQVEEYFWLLLKILGNLHCTYMENTCDLLYIHMENKKITYLTVLWCYLNNIMRSSRTFLWESLLQIHINIFSKNPQKQKTCHELFPYTLTEHPWQESALHRGGMGLAGHGEQCGGGRAVLAAPPAEAAEVKPGSPCAAPWHAQAVPGRSSCSSTRYTAGYLHSLIPLLIFHIYKSPKFLTFPVQQEIQELITSPSDSTKVSNVWLSTTLMQLYLYSCCLQRVQ